MNTKIQSLLKQYKANTLEELSKDLKISLNKIKNISSGRTHFSSLFKKKAQYRIFPKHSKELAEVIGIVLGDGNIFQFDRCQRLTISCNSFYRQYIKHIQNIINDVFRKEPSIIKRSKEKCTDICLYMQDIDKALGMPTGNKIKNSVKIPAWVFKNKNYLKKCLKGLFETDGHYGISKKFYIEYMQFCNKSSSLRNSVFRALKSLGYSPQLGNSYVRLAKRTQVSRLIKEMNFERPFPSLANN